MFFTQSVALSTAVQWVMVFAIVAAMVTTSTAENATDLLMDITPTVTDNTDTPTVPMDKSFKVTLKHLTVVVFDAPPDKPRKEATFPPVAQPALLAPTLMETTSTVMLVALKMETVANAIVENDSVPSHLSHN